MKKGIIFDIKRYAIHDGRGIRTTIFLKGCPLFCFWCHNPESISREKEIMFRRHKCIRCFECLELCPNNAISEKNGLISINKKKCDLCGICAENCCSEALQLIGTVMNVSEVMKEVEKDIVFYDESGGGVTFSGGEPLFQVDFLNSLLERCKEMNIHTTIDTSGYAPFDSFEKIMGKVDIFYFDLKTLNEEDHLKYTGKPCALIKSNLRKLCRSGAEVVLRFPLIPGVNDTDKDINEIIDFVYSLKVIQNVHILPFHTIGLTKYNDLRKPNKNLNNAVVPSEKLIESVKKRFENKDFCVIVGG
ncbi:glycyl-radical enzyme activating protein [candidate division KSB1 bacterium]